MLRRNPEPLALSEASLLAFRPALNAPVLNVEFMPVGPARAAIVVFAEEYGGIGLALGIRSINGGQIAVFRNREPLGEEAVVSEVFEPALAAAERLGFLFDKEMIDGISGDRGRSKATRLWGQLMGEVGGKPASTAIPPLETVTPPAADPILELVEPLEAAPEVTVLELEEVAVEPPPSPTRLLSRFRRTKADKQQDDAPVAAEPPGSEHTPRIASTLFRIPLVRMTRTRNGSSRVPYLARLLSNF